jgi:transcriptional regulator with XRE-family HTH domain
MAEPMARTEFHLLRERLGWSLAHLARYAKRDNSRIRKMASGAEQVDQELADWLRHVEAAYRRDDWGEYDGLIHEGVPIKRP